MSSTKMTIACPKGFTVINGNLVEISLKSVRRVADGRLIYTDDKGNEYENIVLYQSAADFERNNPLTTEVYFADQIMRYRHFQNESGEFVGSNFECPYAFHVSSDGQNWTRAEVQYPENTYETREECIANSVYKEILADGTIVEHRGLTLRSALTDEQKLIVAEVEAVLKKASDNGIGLVFDICYDNLKAFNTDNGTIVSTYRYDLASDAPYTFKIGVPIKSNVGFANDEIVLCDVKHL